MTDEQRMPHRELAIFSYGFRPFFLSATVYAGVAIFCWMLLLDGSLELSGPFTPTDWHIHEMLFGYASAVIAGFLFTAIPNWTGRAPKHGWPLIVLVILWLAGRVAVSGVLGVGQVGVMLADLSFLVAIVATIVVEIVAGRNWRNLMVVVPVMLLLAANLTFHLEVHLTGVSDIGRRLGAGVIVFLIMLIGGRIIPSFTRNWLVKQNSEKLPVAMSRFDAICLLTGGGVLLGWSFFPYEPITGWTMLGAAGLQGLRLSRWQGVRTWRSPLLLMLHVAYAFIPLGLAATGAASIGWVSPAAGAHLLGIGAIGGMTMAVMIRASLGHTGHKLEAGPLLSVAAGMIFVAAFVRVCFPEAFVGGVSGLWMAAALWIAGFTIFSLKIGPYLTRTNRKPT
ncbi:NnrS family protein [Nisaea nitritireducens]|uniref:NnrS family protein n=1 Tax=Nisaea nitritireducens TaxID=568392 RepID=UPI001868CC3D|nr:NnrS family protein [Nisaea nitritireducens]